VQALAVVSLRRFKTLPQRVASPQSIDRNLFC
jgi:hypothetical protein